jgi:hypothetical protein
MIWHIRGGDKMEWRDLDEYTMMHMMGYGQSIWTVDMFRDTYKNDESICYRTLVWICEYYIKQWGSNDDVKEILQYLEGIEYI